jgi:hypothetical protein
MPLRKIFLSNKEEINFEKSDLPMLIHGIDGSGASFFSISVAGNFFLTGNKILFFTAYPPGKEEFYVQITKSEKEKTVFVDKEDDLAGAEHYSAIVIKSGDFQLCLSAIKSLSDISERIVFVKNIETILTDELLSEIKKLNYFIFSGDIDRAAKITGAYFTTKIFFSRPQIDISSDIPDLLKHNGYLVGKKKGIAKMQV